MKHRYPLALIDLDSMLYIVAYKQWASGNRDNSTKVYDHVRRFFNTIKVGSNSDYVIPIFQGDNHHNFRKDLAGSYKEHRTTPEWITHWKPTVLEAFRKLSALELKHIETDDAQSLIAHHYGPEKVVIVSGDKDMLQINCAAHYNPYKMNLKYEERWMYPNSVTSLHSLYSQVLMGDSTDIGLDKCGIYGIGPSKAKKALKNASTKEECVRVIQKMYTDKYGEVEGRDRAVLTFRIVKLLETGDEKYITDEARKEAMQVIETYSNYRQPSVDVIENLFSNIP